MAAEDESGQERTEEPTARRISQARSKGQVLRSKELGTASVLIGGACGLIFLQSFLGETLMKVMHYCFALDRDFVFDTTQMMTSLAVLLKLLLLPMGLFLLVMLFTSVLGNTLLGGFNFSWQAIAPRWSKLNPINGLKRIFGAQALIELIKSILKVICVTVFVWVVLANLVYEVLSLSEYPYQVGILEALKILLWIGFVLACSMLPILLVDVPFQKWEYTRQLKMTRQQVKDEFKDTEGKPEVKGRIRRAQMEMAARRMMAKVPKADVVITNPTHYAIALRYDADVKGAAPVVVAKGVDALAMKIMEVARHYDVHVISSPVLARSIYHTTELDREIPEGLYLAVAQVLAYVYQLNQFQKGRGKRPKPLAKSLPIPESLRH